MLIMNTNKKLKADKLVFDSIFIGTMLSCNILSVLFSFIPNGIVILIFIPFVFLCLNNFKTAISRENLWEIIVLFNFFICFFLYSLFVGRYSESTIKYILEFVVLGLPFVIASHFDFYPLIVLKTIVILSLISLPLYILNINIDIVSYDTDGEALMSVSYNLIKMMIPALLLLFFERKLLIIILSCITIILPGVLLLNIGSRGAILCIFMAFILSLIYIKNKKINICSSQFVFVLFVVLIFALYFVDIVNVVYSIFTRYNIQSIALERIVLLLENDKDFSTGRGVLYETAIVGFLNSPIFGNGIGSFDNYSGRYPHNLFIQQLYEGGIVWGIPMIYITVYSFVKLNSNMDKQRRYFLIYLVTASVVHLLMSSYFWSSSIYWFLMGLIFHELTNYKVLKNKI